MKLSRKIGYALIALTLCFGVTSCCNDDDEVENIKQQDYSKEIVGKTVHSKLQKTLMLLL